MADLNLNRIQFLRTNIGGKKPTISQILEGELAINLLDRMIYTRHGNNIVELGFAKGGNVDGDINQVSGNFNTVGDISGNRLAVNSIAGNGDGVSLYGGYSEFSGLPTHGSSVAMSNLFGTHGAVTGNWNHYITMGGAKNRGFIFRNDGNNIASINNSGIATFSKVIAPIQGNADSATKLQTPRTINGIGFDGTSNIEVPVLTKNIDDTDINTPSIFFRGTASDNIGYIGLNIKSTSAGFALQIGQQHYTSSKLRTRSLVSGKWTDYANVAYLDDNVASAAKLQTARTINGVGFDGTTNISINKTVATRLNTNDDLNAFNTEGNWFTDVDAIASTIKNSPTKLSFNLEVKNTAGCIQILRTYSSNKVEWKRYYYENSWSPWYRVYSEADPQPYANLRPNGMLTKIEEFDTATKEGMYLISGVAPENLYNYGILEVIKYEGTILQRYTAHVTDKVKGSVAVRQTWNNSFKDVPWRVIDRDNLGTGGSINGDLTVNGKLTVNQNLHLKNSKMFVDGNLYLSNTTDNVQTPVAIGKLYIGSAYSNGLAATPNYGILTRGDIKTDSNIIATGNITGAKIITANEYLGIYTTDSQARVIATGGVLASDAYVDSSKVPVNGIYSKGIIESSSNIKTLAWMYASKYVSATGGDAVFQGSLTGNSASTAKLQTARTINGTPFDGTKNIIITDPTFTGYLKDHQLDDYDYDQGGVTFRYLTPDANNHPTGNDKAVTTMRYNDLWATQQAFDWRTNQIHTRVQNNGTWTDWDILARISDNVASATKLQTARTIGGVSFNGTANINLPGVNTPGNQNTSGNADSATRVQNKQYDYTTDVALLNALDGNSGAFFDNGIGKSLSQYTAGLVSSYNSGGIFVIGASSIDGLVKVMTGVKNAGSNTTNIKTSTLLSTTANAASATKLQTARAINGVPFDGTSNIVIQDNTKLSLQNGGTVTASVTVNGTLFGGGVNSTYGMYAKEDIKAGRDILADRNIIATGNVTAFSDKRLKENIVIINSALDKVSKLTGVTFTRNDLKDKNKRYVGLIAQDVQAVVPEAISENENGILGVDYQGLVGLLVEAVKELSSEIKELKNGITN